MINHVMLFPRFSGTKAMSYVAQIHLPHRARRSLLLSPCELSLRLKETSLRETPNLSPNKSSLGRPNMLRPCRCIYYNIYIYNTILYIQNIWKPIYICLVYHYASLAMSSTNASSLKDLGDLIFSCPLSRLAQSQATNVAASSTS